MLHPFNNHIRACIRTRTQHSKDTRHHSLRKHLGIQAFLTELCNLKHSWLGLCSGKCLRYVLHHNLITSSIRRGTTLSATVYHMTRKVSINLHQSAI